MWVHVGQCAGVSVCDSFATVCVYVRMNPHGVYFQRWFNCSASIKSSVQVLLWPCAVSLTVCGISWRSRNTDKEWLLKKCETPYPHNP